MIEIPTKTLPNGDEMPILGLGTWQMEGQECFEAVQSALGMGYRHIDTADMYDNHHEVGKAIRGMDREDVFLVTKLLPKDLQREDVIAAVDRFLEELQTEYLDLLLIHWPNRRIPLDETFEGMQEIVDRGQVRSVGVSNFTISHLQNAMNASDLPIVCNQVEYHPGLDQQQLLGFCQDHGIPVVGYSPLGKARYLGDESITKVAEQCGCTPAQAMLAWLRHKDIIAIPKASTPDHLRENLESLDVELSPEQIQELDRLGSEDRIINPGFAEFGATHAA